MHTCSTCLSIYLWSILIYLSIVYATHCNTIYDLSHITQCVSAKYGKHHVAGHYNTLQHTATHCNTLQHAATHCNKIHECVKSHSRASNKADTTLQHTATHRNTLQHTATHCDTLQHIATHCNTLQHTATYYNTLQHVI